MSIIPYSFEGADVRVLTRDGDPWFVLADVCRVLEIGNPRDAAARLDPDEKVLQDISLHVGNIDGANINSLAAGSGNNTAWLINESGLYSLVLTSRKEAAKRFKKWVTAEVLPAIRKTGGYMVAAPEETPEALALRALKVLQATVERQKAQLAEAAPKAAVFDHIASAEGCLNVTEAAKSLKVRPKDLFSYLREHRWIYKRAGSATWLGYQTRTNDGDLSHRVTTVLRADGSEKIVEQVLITAKGMTKLSALMKPLVMVA